MAEVLWKKADRPETDTRSQGEMWRPHMTLIHEDLAAISQAVAEATPSNARLLELARKYSPPEAWWEEPADPFSPDPSTD